MSGYKRAVGYALGTLLLVATIGCQNPRRQKSDYYTEMAKHTVLDPYSPSQSRSPEPASNKWTCPMHPQIQGTQPGKCSICGMDLIREGESSTTGAASQSSDSHSAPSNRSRSRGSGCCG